MYLIPAKVKGKIDHYIVCSCCRNSSSSSSSSPTKKEIGKINLKGIKYLIKNQAKFFQRRNSL